MITILLLIAGRHQQHPESQLQYTFVFKKYDLGFGRHEKKSSSCSIQF